MSHNPPHPALPQPQHRPLLLPPQLPKDIKPESVPDATVAQVAEALKQAGKVVDVSEDGKRVKRKLPLPSLKEIAIAVDSRSIYARPFRFDSQLDTVQVGCAAAGCAGGCAAGRVAGDCDTVHGQLLTAAVGAACMMPGAGQSYMPGACWPWLNST
jgi:hypothetical protein